MAWTTITNAAVAAGAAITTALMTALRDNITAVAEREAGAPKVLGANYDLLSRTVISGSPSTVDFVFDATVYDEIIFRLANIVPATDGADLSLRTSTDGGATFDTTSYAFAAQTISMAASPVSTLAGSAANSSIPLASSIGSASGEDGVFGNIRLSAPSLAKYTTIFADLVSTENSVGANQSISVKGMREISADVDAVRFLLSSGTFENGGIISAYGVRNV